MRASTFIASLCIAIGLLVSVSQAHEATPMRVDDYRRHAEAHALTAMFWIGTTRNVELACGEGRDGKSVTDEQLQFIRALLGNAFGEEKVEQAFESGQRIGAEIEVTPKDCVLESRRKSIRGIFRDRVFHAFELMTEMLEHVPASELLK
jgi:hypothetical protein